MATSRPIQPIILSGGSGTRLWPVSTPDNPKQFANLFEGADLFEQTVQRLSGPQFKPPAVIANQRHVTQVQERLGNLERAGGAIILEPLGRNTAPAITAAVLEIASKEPNAICLVCAADSYIRNTAAFVDTVLDAATAAENGKITTFGIPPTHPETGFGYIHKGNLLSVGERVFAVEAFVEKPDVATAERYLASGDYVWNSSMFLFDASVFLDEIDRQRPDIREGCQAALDAGRRDGDAIYLAQEPFAGIESISVDYAVMEGCERVAVADARFDWNDVGSWSAIWEVLSGRADDNVALSNLNEIDSRGCLVVGDENQTVHLLGCQDLVVVIHEGKTLIMPKSRSQDVKRFATEG